MMMCAQQMPAGCIALSSPTSKSTVVSVVTTGPQNNPQPCLAVLPLAAFDLDDGSNILQLVTPIKRGCGAGAALASYQVQSLCREAGAWEGGCATWKMAVLDSRGG